MRRPKSLSRSKVLSKWVVGPVVVAGLDFTLNQAPCGWVYVKGPSIAFYFWFYATI